MCKRRLPARSLSQPTLCRDLSICAMALKYLKPCSSRSLILCRLELKVNGDSHLLIPVESPTPCRLTDRHSCLSLLSLVVTQYCSGLSNHSLSNSVRSGVGECLQAGMGLSAFGS
jgi:hypothetical protein